MPDFENILFDLDGTLTDPKVGIINSILFSLKKLRITEPKPVELERFIGPPLRQSFKERYDLSDALADKAVVYYREYFSEKGIFENACYEGVPELLNFLSASDFKLFLATSKPTVFADRILQHFELKKYFIDIIGCNLDHTRTEKTEIIDYLIKKHKLAKEKTIMIGDRKHDLIGAASNNVKSIAVTYGYGTIEELTESQPDFFAKDSRELKSLLT